jgi:hypothetical protein
MLPCGENAQAPEIEAVAGILGKIMAFAVQNQCCAAAMIYSMP